MMRWRAINWRAGLPAGGRRLRGAVALATLALALGLPPHLTAGLLLLLPQTAAAQSADPDWPCVQRKVPSLSPASMWPGLSEETLVAEWRSEPDVAALVARIAPRRVSVEEAQEAIKSYAEGLEERKREKLELLFVGLFQTLDAERSEVVRGIERFAGKQRQLAERILADRAALAELRQESSPDPETLAERRDQVTWSIRVFEERRESLSYVCEVPRVIEQRLFSLARTLQAELS